MAPATIVASLGLGFAPTRVAIAKMTAQLSNLPATQSKTGQRRDHPSVKKIPAPVKQ